MARLDFIASGDNLLTSNGLQFRVIGQIPVNIDSIEIYLHQTNSDPRTLKKTLSPATKLKGTLREGTSMLNPTILINSGTMFGWNYCYIPSTMRYYFITDVKLQNKNLYEVSLKCDVLMTYKNEILGLTTKVTRAESAHDWTLSDTFVEPKSYAIIGAYPGKILSGAFGYPTPNIPITSSSQFQAYGHLLFKISCSKLNHGSAMSTPSFGYVWASATIPGFETFLQRVYESGYFAGDYKITDVITDIKWMPTALPVMKGEYRFVQDIVFENQQTMFNYVYVGDMDRYTFRIGRDLLTSQETVSWIVNNIPVQTRTYLNSPPFKQMALLFPPFGMVKLESEVWGRKTQLTFTANVDSMTGDANLYVVDGGYKELIANANVAIPIDMTYISKSGREIANAVISSCGNIVKSMGGGVGAVIASAVSEIPKTFILPDFYQISGSGTANANAVVTPILLVKRIEQDEPNKQTEGWLYNKTVRLGSLEGYCKVAPGVHIENQIGFGMATKTEMDEMETLLTSGVILPPLP